MLAPTQDSASRLPEIQGEDGGLAESFARLWLADVAGVFVVAPLLIARLDASRAWTAHVALSLGVAVTLGVVHVLYTNEARIAHTVVRQAVEERADRLQARGHDPVLQLGRDPIQTLEERLGGAARDLPQLVARQHELADPLTELGATRLPREHALAAGGCDVLPKRDLKARLACTIAAFDDDETAGLCVE